MLLKDLVDIFLSDYQLECLKRKEAEIKFKPKQLALMVSKVVSDIQKRLGVIENDVTLFSVKNTNVYNLNISFMDIKSVLYSSQLLDKISADELQGYPRMDFYPNKYAIRYLANQVIQLLVYPYPMADGDTITIRCHYNFNLFSPQDTTQQDFGTYDGVNFSGYTPFPTQYDTALLLGMMKQIFKDIETDYEREMSLLRVKQYNGEKFTYSLGYPL